MKTQNVILLVLAAAFMAGCSLIQSGPTQVTKTFNWTATGDDGYVGTAAAYSIRYSTDSAVLVSSWTTCTELPNPPIPQIAGSAETFTATMTLNTGVTYYFGLKARDEAMNWSLISNIISLTPPDTDPPLRVGDFRFED